MKKLLLFTMTMIAQLGAMAQWAVFPLTAVDISCGSATQFATIRGSGGLWRYNFGTSAYESLNSGAYNFNGVSICADGTLIGKSTNTLSSTSNLVKYNTIPPAFNAFTAITGILNNNICALSNSFAVGSTGGSVNNNIYQWNGSAWSLLPGSTSISAKKVVVGGTSSDIYAMTWAATGNNVMAYNSGTWTAISNSTLNVTDISVGDAGKILAIAGGQLYYRSAGAWVLDVTAPSNLLKVSAASDGTVMLLATVATAAIYRNTWANIICGTTSLPPVNTTASQNLTICSGQAATLTATGTGTLNWSGPSTGVGSTIVTPTLASTSTYSVTNTIGGCTALSLITVSVNPTPPAYSINPSSPICAGNTATLSYPTNCSWYSSPTSTNVIGSSYIFVTPTLTTNTTFYASVTSNGCESPRAVHTVTVKPLPNPPVYVSGNLSYCQGGSTTIFVDVVSNWYSSPTGGNSTQNTIGYGFTNSNTTVYADVTVNGCTSFPRTAITVTVNPLPSVLSQTVQNSTCNGVPNGSIDLTLNNPSNYTYTWTPNVSTTNSATNIAAGVYTVAIEEAGCVLTQTYNVTQPALYNVPVNVLANGTILAFGDMYTGSPSFQWVDCNNSNAPIAGATNATFTPTITGNYALTFGYGSCVSTSTCNTITLATGLNESILLNSISLQPNPASTFFTLNNVVEGTSVNVIDVTGKVVISNSVIDTEKTMTIETDNLSNGIYVIQLKNNGAVAHKKLVISK